MMFTYDAYRAMLAELLGAGYSFAHFDQADDRLLAGTPFVLLRHDIDICLNAAVRMAAIEARAGVVATYFFLVRTEHYNVFSTEGADAVRQILAMGHRAGLHFDCAAYEENCDTLMLAESCAREAEILERWIGQAVSIVSYHRPSVDVLSGDPAWSHPRPHTYMDVYRKPILYLSDSQGRWKFGAPTASEAFQARRPLHLLIHPIWWDERPGTPEERLAAFRRRRLADLDRSLARNCAVYRPERATLR